MTKFLKEWDVVGRALEDGRQILLARKGGILDDDGPLHSRLRRILSFSDPSPPVGAGS
jgi:hypothetical protein